MKDNNAARRLTRFFELYEQKMYRVAYGILHNESQAEDAVMVAFEGIVRSGRVPRNPTSKKAERLAFAAVRNAAIDQYRKNTRERWRTQPLTEDAFAIPTKDSDEPERSILAQAGFDSLIAPLKSSHQEVLRERFVEGNSVRETADKLGISEVSVRKRQQRAIADIRTLKGIGNE